MIKWLLLIEFVFGKIHHLELEEDTRLTIDLSSFVFNEQGFLNVTFESFKIDEDEFRKKKSSDEEFQELLNGDIPQLGFIFEKLNSRGNVKYEQKAGDPVAGEKCALNEPPRDPDAMRQIIELNFDEKAYGEKNFDHLTMKWNSLKQEHGINLEVHDNYDPTVDIASDTRRRRADDDGETSRRDDTSTDEREISQEGVEIKEVIAMKYKFTMTWHFSKVETNGLYELSFHNCFNRKRELLPVTIDMHLTEKNGEHYLGMGEVQFAMVYGFMAILFLVAGFLWLGILRQKSQTVFKIHYLMLALVLFKALSLMFHALDYRFLDLEGKSDAWTIIFYIVHLLKGAVLIVTLTLIGTGWAFIKYVLSEKEKRLFIIVIPIQILVNIAYIIHYEAEEGTKPYSNWSSIMILLDMLCYAFILFPVYWSIRHLQQASLTDGKAQRNMEKLELFRSFLTMFVLYIYFTRMVVYIMRITVPPENSWLAEFCNELATLVFFCFTGWKFRPGCENPYFKIDEEDMVEINTKNSLTENVSNRKKKQEESRNLLESDSEEETILDAKTII